MIFLCFVFVKCQKNNSILIINVLNYLKRFRLCKTDQQQKFLVEALNKFFLFSFHQKRSVWPAASQPAETAAESIVFEKCSC
jgi:hypothetical protein